jgi:hypothetical protein
VRAASDRAPPRARQSSLREQQAKRSERCPRSSTRARTATSSSTAPLPLARSAVRSTPSPRSAARTAARSWRIRPGSSALRAANRSSLRLRPRRPPGRRPGPRPLLEPRPGQPLLHLPRPLRPAPPLKQLRHHLARLSALTRPLLYSSPPGRAVAVGLRFLRAPISARSAGPSPGRGGRSRLRRRRGPAAFLQNLLAGAMHVGTAGRTGSGPESAWRGGNRASTESRRLLPLRNLDPSTDELRSQPALG